MLLNSYDSSSDSPFKAACLLKLKEKKWLRDLMAKERLSNFMHSSVYSICPYVYCAAFHCFSYLIL